MEIRLLNLVGNLAASAVLGAWLLGRLWAMIRWFHARRLKRLANGRVLSLRNIGRSETRNPLLNRAAGVVLGGLAVVWAEQSVSKDVLLLVLVVIVLCVLEFNRLENGADLLSTITLIHSVRVRCADGKDLTELLTIAIGDLPEGRVQTALREVVLRRRSGIGLSESIDALRGMHTYLDEFLLTICLLDGQVGPAMKLALNRLLDRAGRKWDRTSRLRFFKERASGSAQFLQAGALTSIGWLLMNTLLASPVILSNREALFITAGIIVFFSMLLALGLRNPWVSRMLILGILFFAFSPGFSTARLQIPDWIQIQEVTHPIFPEDQAVIQNISQGQSNHGFSQAMDLYLPPATVRVVDGALFAKSPQYSTEPGITCSPKVFLAR